MMVGGVLCVPGVAPAPHPPFFVVLFACLFCYAGAGLCGGGCAAKGRRRVGGLCGVVDVADEFVLVLTITAAHVRFLCVAWTL